MIGLNGDGNGLLSDSSKQGFLLVDGHLGAVVDCPGLIRVVVVAGSSDTFVGVLALQGDAVIDNVPERVIHQSSTTSVISIRMRAIHQLLLRERLK